MKAKRISELKYYIMFGFSLVILGISILSPKIKTYASDLPTAIEAKYKNNGNWAKIEVDGRIMYDSEDLYKLALLAE